MHNGVLGCPVDGTLLASGITAEVAALPAPEQDFGSARPRGCRGLRWSGGSAAEAPTEPGLHPSKEWWISVMSWPGSHAPRTSGSLRPGWWGPFWRAPWSVRLGIVAGLRPGV